MNDIDRYFSPDYFTARRRFREYVAARGGRLGSLNLNAKGPKGEDLTIDIGWFGALHQHRVMVHSSGLHGVEAFAGSAIQIQWLDEGIPPLSRPKTAMMGTVRRPWGHG